MTTYTPKTPFLYHRFLELRNWEGSVSKQLAQRPEFEFQLCYYN